MSSPSPWRGPQRARPAPTELLAQWHAYMSDPLLSLAQLRSEADRGVLFDQRALRSLSWRFFLGLLPAPTSLASPSDASLPASPVREPYSRVLGPARDAYAQLRERYLRSPDGRWVSDGDGEGDGEVAPPPPPAGENEGPRKVEDLRVNNPLGLDDENPWTGWFRDVELRKEIRKDVQRTFPEVDYFRLATTQDRMTDLLFIWCKLAPEIGYRQGMHELLAPLLWFVDYDSLPAPTPPAEWDLAHVVLAREWVEHDAWALFAAVMQPARAFYDPRPSAALSPPRASAYPPPHAAAAPSPAAPLVQPIVALAARVHALVGTVDPALARAFTRVGVEPQLYALRWFRLVFSRELPLAATLTLWDALFAADPSLRLVAHVALALLLRARRPLLAAAGRARDGGRRRGGGADYGAFVQTLLRYPPCPDGDYRPALLVQQALYLRDHASPAGAAHVRTQNEALGAALVAGDGAAGETDEEDDDEWDGEGEPRAPLARATGHRRTQTAGTAQGLGFFGGDGLVGDLAKGVLARGEALGIHKALRGTLDEIKRSVAEAQSLADERRRPRPPSAAAAGGFSQLPSRAPWDPQRSPPRPPPVAKDQDPDPNPDPGAHSLAAELAAMRAANAGMSAAVLGAVGVLERALLRDEDRGDEGVHDALEALRRVGDVLGGRAAEGSLGAGAAETPGGTRPVVDASRVVSSPPLPSLSPTTAPTARVDAPAAGVASAAVPPAHLDSSGSIAAAGARPPLVTPSLYLSARTDKPLPSLSRTPQPSSTPSPRVADPPVSAYPPVSSTSTSTGYPPPRSPAAAASSPAPAFPAAGFSVRPASLAARSPAPALAPAPTPAPTAPAADPLGVASFL
ncbi:hypothetical protein JCM3770_000100 [Rhodotorula araucariae]